MNMRECSEIDQISRHNKEAKPMNDTPAAERELVDLIVQCEQALKTQPRLSPWCPRSRQWSSISFVSTIVRTRTRHAEDFRWASWSQISE